MYMIALLKMHSIFCDGILKELKTKDDEIPR